MKKVCKNEHANLRRVSLKNANNKRTKTKDFPSQFGQGFNLGKDRQQIR